MCYCLALDLIRCTLEGNSVPVLGSYRHDNRFLSRVIVSLREHRGELLLLLLSAEGGIVHVAIKGIASIDKLRDNQWWRWGLLQVGMKEVNYTLGDVMLVMMLP